MSDPSREAFLSNNQNGMDTVVVTRFKKAAGLAECGVFLIDFYCLGVKNAFFSRIPVKEYPDFIKKIFRGVPPQTILPADGRKLVEDAVRYARALGFGPQKDYKMAARVFGGIDPGQFTREYEFGSNGKPCFIPGPDDSEEKIERVIAQLTRSCGEEGFQFMAAIEGF